MSKAGRSKVLTALLRVLSVVLILSGVLVVAYPKLAALQQQSRQQKLLDEWQLGFSAVATTQGSEVTISSDAANAASGAGPTPIAPSTGTLPVIGTLRIEKIGLELPILQDATIEHLNISISTIEPCGKMGQPGNFAVAGHNSYDYGHNFNRLDELQPGDIITADNVTEYYTYTITEKLYVAPNDTWVLLGDERKSITLVTCYPMRNPTQRLIIKGEILE